MASKKGEGAGNAGSAIGVGKVGKLKQEGRQNRLVTEKKTGGKRVTFRLERDKNGEERSAELKESRKELRKKLKKLKEKWDKV